MPNCAIKRCKNYLPNTKLKSRGVSFHMFPKDLIFKKKWIDAVRREGWFPSPRTTICSEHFAETCFDLSKKRRSLLANSIPTLKLDVDEIKQDEQMQVEADTVITNVPASTSVERASNNLPCSIIDTPRKKKLKSRVMYLEHISNQRLLKIKRLQNNQRRLKIKIHRMEDLFIDLKKKNLLNSTDLDILKSINVSSAEIFKRQFKKSKNLPNEKKYSDQLRSFALTLHYLSPKAYSYVRQSFDSCLPHISTISKWYQNINGNPGFTAESLDTIKNKVSSVNYPVLCSLVLDEMAIRKRVEWDGTKFNGYVTLSGDAEGDYKEEAKDALVFLIVAVNSDWKIPIGYFLVNGITGEQRANLVCQSLSALKETGVQVISLTFDACPSNLNMAKILGCDLSTDKMKSTFVDKSTKKEVAIFIDPCHALKLIRNCFQAKTVLYDSDHLDIQWKYLELLEQLQKDEGFVLANKLKAKHLNFQNNIMKVKLASQLFSKSVSVALDFCANRLNIAEFSGVSGTCKFLLIINDLFDIFNSRNLLQGGYKKPLNPNNADNILNFLDLAEKYIRTLYILEEKFDRARNQEIVIRIELICSKRKSGFIGFLLCIQSLKFLYKTYVLGEKLLKYISTYKLNQDHLEMFFSNIRSKGGFNNNPTALQFRAAYRKMLVRSQLYSHDTGNCVPLEDITILTCSSAVMKINKTDERSRLNHLDESEIIDHDLHEISNCNEFSKAIINYIAGFVVKKIKRSVSCERCVSACIASSEIQDKNLHLSFIKIKDLGGLIYPSADVVLVCSKTEQSLRSYIYQNRVKSSFNKQTFINSLMRWFIGINIFKSLYDHQFDQDALDNHLNYLIKAIIEIYSNIRLHYVTKCWKDQEYSKRQMYNKLILFKGHY